MNKRFFTLCLALMSMTVSALADDVLINEENFPDQKFREFLSSQNFGTDGKLTDEEQQALTMLSVRNKGIKDLKGIEFFPMLSSLYCSKNSLTSIDVSKNTELVTLECKDNQLTSLDLSKNTKLRCLYCERNKLSSLDVSACPELFDLLCEGNQIKGSGMDILVNGLHEKLFGTEKLQVRNESYTQDNVMTLTQVKIAKDKGWRVLIDNGVDRLDYEGEELHISINESNFPDANFRNYLLQQTYGEDEVLTEKELQKITMLSVSKKGIKNLKGIEFFTMLSSLFCSKNSLTSIDVSKNTELVTLDCKDNQLTSLDLSKNTKLKCLYCERNKLTSLDVSACPELFDLRCEGNQIKGSGMDILVNGLHEKLFGTEMLRVRNESYSPDNVMTPSQVKIAKDKGWRVLIDNGVDRFDYKGEALSVSIDETNFPDANFRNYLLQQTYGKDKVLTEEELRAIDNLELTNSNISSLKGIEYFHWLEVLFCSNNQLTSLDLTNCKKLSGLYCIDNQIKDEQMDALIASLPRGTGGSLYVIDEDNGLEHNVCTAQQVAAAEEKEWTVIFLAGHLWRSNYPGSDMGIAIGVTNFPDDNFRAYISSNACDTDENGFLTSAELAAVTIIGVNGKGIKNLKGVEFFTALEGLYCKNNSELESLDLSKNTALKWLSCNYCGLTSLNLLKNTELVDLDCGGNKLTELNLTNNTKLKTLRCYKNQLTSLDVSNNNNLYYVGCHQNNIKALQMGQLVNDLPDVNHLESNPKFQFYVEFNAISDTDEGNILTTTQVAAARAKGWNVNAYSGSVDDFDGFVEINETNFPDAKFRKFVADKTIDKNEDGYLSETEVKAVTTMDVKGLVIKKLNGIEYFKELQVLHCHGNALTTLDLSKNTKLTKVDCVGNQIKGEGMDKLVNSLPEVEGGELCVNDDYRTSDNTITAAQVKVATNKGWRVMKITVTGDADYAGQGDANGDNKINQDDLNLIEQIVMGNVPEGVVKLAGDLNHDGKVDAADIVILVNILNGK